MREQWREDLTESARCTGTLLLTSRAYETRAHKNLILGGIKAKQRNVDMVRRPRPEHRRRDGPVRMRNKCLHSDKFV